MVFLDHFQQEEEAVKSRRSPHPDEDSVNLSARRECGKQVKYKNYFASRYEEEN